METQSWTNKEGVNFKVGDYVTGYSPGVHRIVKIERRFRTADDVRWYKKYTVGEEYPALMHLTTVLNSKYKPMKRDSKCDAGFCRPVTPDTLHQQLAEITKTYLKAIEIISK